MTAENTARLLERYPDLLGDTADVAELLAEHPEFADVLREAQAANAARAE